MITIMKKRLHPQYMEKKIQVKMRYCRMMQQMPLSDLLKLQVHPFWWELLLEPMYLQPLCALNYGR